MKKIILTASATLCIAFINAQNLSLGPVAGFGHSWLSVENNTQANAENKFYPSYNGGARLVYSFISHWGVSADVKFSGEGGKMESMDAGDNIETKYRANYIRVPIQGIYFFGELGDAIRPKISIGPSLGFLVGGESSQTINGSSTNTIKTKDIFQDFDFAINGAAGVNFRIQRDTWLNAEVNYMHGLTNVSESSGPDFKNRNIVLNIGVTFPLGTVKPD